MRPMIRRFQFSLKTLLIAMNGDGAVEVVTTSAAGKVHVFDGKGMELDTLEPGIYANMVRAFRLPGESADGVLVVGGGVGQAQMAAISGKGDLLWQPDLPDKVTHCDSLAFAPGTTWAALGCRGGLVCMIDVSTGEIIGAASHQGMMPQVAWAPTDDQPLLLAATRGALKAWRVKPKDSGDAK